MTIEQQKAYEWAIAQNYPSVAARYAKLLAEMIDELNDFEHSQCAKLLVENGQLRNVITQMDPDFFTRKCRVCGCDWNHPCKGGCSWVGDDLCSACFQKMLRKGKKDG